MRLIVCATIVMAFSLVVAGCGGSSGLLPATGTVTYQGKPVEGAAISFMPDGTGKAMGIGSTDASGKYVIRTAGKVGATPGKNLVSISKQSLKGGASDMKPEDMQKMYQKTRGAVQESLLPVKYANPSQSGLSADVQSGKSVFDFELKD